MWPRPSETSAATSRGSSCRRRPARLITVHDDPFRPQPRIDRDADGGMTTSVGRVRADAALKHGVKYVLVSHNTKMGAASGAVLTAECLALAGYL
jgi:aspartate-semialdehyde dehydrogenase